MQLSADIVAPIHLLLSVFKSYLRPLVGNIAHHKNVTGV